MKGLYVKVQGGHARQTRTLTKNGDVRIDYNDNFEVIGIEFLNYKELRMGGKAHKESK